MPRPVAAGPRPHRSIRPRRPRNAPATPVRRRPDADSGDTGARDDDDDSGATTTTPAPTTTTTGADGDGVDPEDERQSFGEGNRRGSAPASRPRRPGPARGDGRPGEYQGDPIPVQGLLDLRPEGYGFLRGDGYLPAQKDVYVSASQVRRFALRKGDFVTGTSRPQASNEKYPALAARRRHQRPDARRRPRPAALRRPHAAVPRRQAPPRAGLRPAARSPVASST